MHAQIGYFKFTSFCKDDGTFRFTSNKFTRVYLHVLIFENLIVNPSIQSGLQAVDYPTKTKEVEIVELRKLVADETSSTSLVL